MYAGKKLRQLRLKLDINQTEMAKSLGLSQSYYSAVEAGKRKITPRMIEKISTKWKINEGYFSSQNTLYNDKKMGGSNGGDIEGVINELAQEKGYGGENKAILATYKLIEKLFTGNSSQLKTEEISKILLAETEKWDDKTLNYYIRSTQEITRQNPELNAIYKMVSEVITDSVSLNKIIKTYFEPALNNDIEYTDYEGFKAERIENFEKLLKYQDVLKPLSEALANFISNFNKIQKSTDKKPKQK